MTKKEFFKLVNHTAYENFDFAQGMLESYNLLNGTSYFFINKRVCYETVDHGVRTFHDAWVWAD